MSAFPLATLSQDGVGATLDGVGPSLSITMILVAEAVPYFWYSLPWTRTLARTLYRFAIP